MYTNTIGEVKTICRSQGPEAIDIAARSLSLTHISIPELARKELARREKREKQYKKAEWVIIKYL